MYVEHDTTHIDELREELLSLLRGRSTYDWEFIRRLAHESGLSRGTIQRLIEGKTKRPAITTVGALNHALGYKLVRVWIGNGLLSGNKTYVPSDNSVPPNEKLKKTYAKGNALAAETAPTMADMQRMTDDLLTDPVAMDKFMEENPLPPEPLGEEIAQNPNFDFNAEGWILRPKEDDNAGS